MEWLLGAYDHSFEKELLNSVSREIPWKLVESFSRLKRDSGTEGEREAARYITSRLESFGIPYQLYEPELYLSLPEWANFRSSLLLPLRSDARPLLFLSTDGKVDRRKSGLCPHRDGREDRIPLCRRDEGCTQDVRGKIVLTEGVFAPQKAWEFESRGAIGQIYINPGTLIHEANFSTVWGTPP